MTKVTDQRISFVLLSRWKSSRGTNWNIVQGMMSVSNFNTQLQYIFGQFHWLLFVFACLHYSPRQGMFSLERNDWHIHQLVFTSNIALLKLFDTSDNSQPFNDDSESNMPHFTVWWNDMHCPDSVMNDKELDDIWLQRGSTAPRPPSKCNRIFMIDLFWPAVGCGILPPMVDLCTCFSACFDDFMNVLFAWF